MLDLECRLVEMFGWSLNDMDLTDIETLLPFVFYYPHWKEKGKAPGRRKMRFADEVSWL